MANPFGGTNNPETNPKQAAEKLANMARRGRFRSKYTAKEGDSWFSIAGQLFQGFMGWDAAQAQKMAFALAKANPDIGLLKPGMVINVPVPSFNPKIPGGWPSPGFGQPELPAGTSAPTTTPPAGAGTGSGVNAPPAPINQPSPGGPPDWNYPSPPPTTINQPYPGGPPSWNYPTPETQAPPPATYGGGPPVRTPKSAYQYNPIYRPPAGINEPYPGGPPTWNYPTAGTESIVPSQTAAPTAAPTQGIPGGPTPGTPSSGISYPPVNNTAVAMQQAKFNNWASTGIMPEYFTTSDFRLLSEMLASQGVDIPWFDLASMDAFLTSRGYQRDVNGVYTKPVGTGAMGDWGNYPWVTNVQTAPLGGRPYSYRGGSGRGSSGGGGGGGRGGGRGSASGYGAGGTAREMGPVTWRFG